MAFSPSAIFFQMAGLELVWLPLCTIVVLPPECARPPRMGIFSLWAINISPISLTVPGCSQCSTNICWVDEQWMLTLTFVPSAVLRNPCGSPQQHCIMSSWHPRFRDEETKAWRRYIMCPRSPIRATVDRTQAS